MARRILRYRIKRGLVRVRRRVPPGRRIFVGLMLMAGGVLGFLPVLGFWMLPLGAAVAWLDIVAFWRRLRGTSPRRRPH